jgi:hypothetical protein
MREGARRREAGDVRDAVAFECQHEQRERAADVGVWVFDVLAERGLGVGPRRNEAVGAVSCRERMGVKLLDRFTAPVLVRLCGPRPRGRRRAAATSPDAVWWGGALALAMTGAGFLRLGHRVPDPLLQTKSQPLAAAAEPT